MVVIRQVDPPELELARELHNRFTAQERSTATVRSWFEAVPELFLFAENGGDPIGVCTGRPADESEAGGYVDEFYAACGYEPERLLVMTSLANLPGNYRELGYDIAEDCFEHGTKKLYIDVEELDQSFREEVGEAFGTDEAMYIMAKELSRR